MDKIRSAALSIIVAFSLLLGSLAYTPPEQEAQAWASGGFTGIYGVPAGVGDSVMFNAKVTTQYTGTYHATLLLIGCGWTVASPLYITEHEWVATVGQWHYFTFTSPYWTGNYPVVAYEWCGSSGGTMNAVLKVYDYNWASQGTWYSSPFYIEPYP
jgi:hypothetical protein